MAGPVARRAHPVPGQAGRHEAAAVAAPGPARLSDIQHVVILMQENRSFDHYFGTLSAVRGFSDPHVPTQDVGGSTYPIFDQFGYQPGTGADPTGYLQPFHLVSDPPLKDGQTTNDIAHDWGTQHRSWNGGAHGPVRRRAPGRRRRQNGPLTMGYFTRQELAFYYALADAFTDLRRLLLLGARPHRPNRIMAMSAHHRPGRHGPAGRWCRRRDRIAHYGRLSWETMPERAAGRRGQLEGLQPPAGRARAQPAAVLQGLHRPALGHRHRADQPRRSAPPCPDDFHDDVAAGQAAVGVLAHPAAGPVRAPGRAARVRRELRPGSCSARWWPTPRCGRRRCCSSCTTRTAASSTTCPRSRAPAGTAGEWLTGARCPPARRRHRRARSASASAPRCLVVSPFSRGGYLCSDVFDHTSLLRFIETRFGVEVPNLSAWRRARHRRHDQRARPGQAAGHVGVPPLPGTSLGDVRWPSRPSLTRWPAPSTSASRTRFPRRTPCRPRRRARPGRRRRPARAGAAADPFLRSPARPGSWAWPGPANPRLPPLYRSAC